MAYLRKLTLIDIGPFKNASFDFDAVNIIRGANGSGKTTLLKCVESIFENEHDFNLVRRGAEKGEIKGLLSDGTTIERSITEKETKAKVKTAAGVVVPRVETYLKGLASGFALDPLSLLTAKPADRAKVLLDLMPISFEPEEIKEACNPFPNSPHPVAVTEPLDLQQFNGFLAGKEQERTDLNRKMRDREGMRNTLATGIDEDDGTDWRTKHADLSAELEAAREELRALLKQSEKDADLLKEEVKENGDAEIEAIRAEMEARIQAVRDRVTAQRADIDAKAKEVLAEMRAPIDQRIEQLASECAVVEIKSTRQIKAAGVRDSLKKLDDEIASSKTASVHYDMIIDRLRALKQKKLEALPIKGVEVKDGRIYVDGLDFDTQLNTMAQIALVFEIRALAHPKVPIVINDRGGDADDENFAAICEGAKAAGMQLLITKAEAGVPLTVEAA